MRILLILLMLVVAQSVYASHGTETTETTLNIKQCMEKGRSMIQKNAIYFEMDELLHNGIIAYIFRHGEYVNTITCIKGYKKPDTMRETKQSIKNREEDQQDSINKILNEYRK